MLKPQANRPRVILAKMPVRMASSIVTCRAAGACGLAAAVPGSGASPSGGASSRMTKSASGTAMAVNSAAKPSSVACQLACCSAMPSSGVMTAMPAMEPVERKNSAMPRRRWNQRLMMGVSATGLVNPAPMDISTPKLASRPQAVRVFAAHSVASTRMAVPASSTKRVPWRATSQPASGMAAP
jgi:hypothetical protein